MAKKKVLVLGMGNPLLKDDGIGLLIARTIKSRINNPEIEVLEASLGGINLLDILVGYEKAVLIDAAQTSEGIIGKLYKLTTDMLAGTRHINSTHDLTLSDALKLGEKLGMSLPREIIIYAIEAKDVTTFSEDISPELKQYIPEYVEVIIKDINLLQP